jgi:hypothetical protein
MNVSKRWKNMPCESARARTHQPQQQQQQQPTTTTAAAAAASPRSVSSFAYSKHDAFLDGVTDHKLSWYHDVLLDLVELSLDTQLAEPASQLLPRIDNDEEWGSLRL